VVRRRAIWRPARPKCHLVSVVVAEDSEPNRRLPTAAAARQHGWLNARRALVTQGTAPRRIAPADDATLAKMWWHSSTATMSGLNVVGTGHPGRQFRPRPELLSGATRGCTS
jgi:hypothetical protein